ncbi:MAG: DNA mismatch repair protein MutS [Clostridiales bacterium]|nr:MAG: DNA mismatch repair protein MutS [Clostridiales bacterium]
MGQYSPAMRQYLEIKKQNSDAFLFYRMGDFYEMFFDDAINASKLLDITLTGKDCGMDERAPMCGVPYHSAEAYINRLISMGYKVAVCEQLEDPSKAKGIVSRGVVRRITPGTIVDTDMLEGSKNNFIASLYRDETAEDAPVGLCFADISSGTLKATVIDGEAKMKKLIGELSAIRPSEIIICGDLGARDELAAFIGEHNIFRHIIQERLTTDICAVKLLEQTGRKTPDELKAAETEEIVFAAGYLLSYLENTVMCHLGHMNELVVYQTAKFMALPWETRYSLELTETMIHKERKGSLLGVIDRTKSAMGGRLLRTWIEQPLYSIAEITRRQNAVAELFADTVARGELARQLGEIYDAERLMGSIMYGSANAKTLLSLGRTLEKFPDIRKLLEGRQSEELKTLYADIDPLEDIRALISSAVVDDPPFTVREGKMIRRGYNKELDDLIYISANGRELVTQYEQAERERTGLKSLKVGYNRVFGYYIEVSKLYSEQIPPEYVRKQTVSNCERYITSALKELETTILQADDRICSLEYELFCALRDKVKAESARIMRSAAAVARLDAYLSMAETAALNNYTRPDVDLSGEIQIKDGRHPVVETLCKDTVFVPNDTALDCQNNRLAIITGPNMAGKSTYMRQVALIVILAHIGSFVPAASARIGLVDKIFTRIGASDELAAGKSTFMVEMSETAAILSSATKNSLLIFDEIGRGTSTFDGMSIARAVLEYVANPKYLGAKTLFATHYHELTTLENQVSGVRNYQITAKKRGDEILFLRKIIPGGADDSYGIEVGQLAGLPKQVIRRAKDILAELEAGGAVSAPAASRKKSVGQNEASLQDSLDADKKKEFMLRLSDLQVETMTPLEALNVLFKAAKDARELID